MAEDEAPEGSGPKPRVLATYLRFGDPAEVLEDIVAQLHAADDPDEAARDIGCGELESLFHQGHSEVLWPRMEELARRDPLFRRALRNVCASQSPVYEQMRELLEELGEFRTAAIGFVVEPAKLGSPEPLWWRAVEPDLTISPRELARILGELAQWAERRADDLEERDRIVAMLGGTTPAELVDRYLEAQADDGSDAVGLIERGVRPDGERLPADLWRTLILRAIRSWSSALDLELRPIDRSVPRALGGALEALVAEHPEQAGEILDGRRRLPLELIRQILLDDGGHPDRGTTWWWADGEQDSSRSTRHVASRLLGDPPPLT